MQRLRMGSQTKVSTSQDHVNFGQIASHNMSSGPQIKMPNSNLPKVNNQKITMMNQHRSLSSSGQKIMQSQIPNSQLIKTKIKI